MRTLLRGLKLFALGGFVLFSTIATAQEYYRSGVLHVKFKKELSQAVAGMRVSQSARGAVITGMAAVDRISAERGVRKFKRIFREAGKFEAAHRAFGLHLWYEIEYDTSFAVGQVKADYEGTNQFEVVEQPRMVRQIGPVAPGPISPLHPAGTNDPLFGDQWHYENTGQTGGTAGADISLVPAWTVETGSDEVIVAVIDGGIDILHPDLAAAMWINTDEIPGNGIDDDLNGYIDDVNGYGFGDNTGTLHPDFHGTHVAGTVGAVTSNSIGVAGIAGGSGTGNGVRLMSCAGFGLFGVGGFEDAMVYAADNGAVISQNSWGGGSTAIEAAIDYFIARAGLDNSVANFGMNLQTGPMRGGIVIFAAGNSNTNDPNIGYPGSYAPVMAVASTDHNDKRSSFSNYGTWVDIAAPGSSVLSTYPVDLGSYALLSGTSMACPHVSGAAALIISKFKGPGYEPAQVWGRLQGTTDNIDAENPAFVGLLGSGRLNAFHTLQSDDGVPPDPITDLTVTSELLTSIRLTWTATGGSGLVGAASYYDLRYSASPITETNFTSATRVSPSPKPRLSGSTEVFEVTGLLHTTTYYFAIKAGDYFENLSAISNVVSATTPEPPIVGVSPSSLSATLYTGGQESQVLTISNTGASDLIFEIGVQSIAPSSVSTATAGNDKIVAGLKRESPAQSGAYRDLALWHSAAQSARVSPAASPLPFVAGRIFLLTGPDEISEISPIDGAVIRTMPTPESASGGPDGLAFDGDYLYFINAFGTGTLYKIDPADGSVEGTLSLQAEIGGVDALGHSGSHLYALNYGNSTIYEIDFDAGIVVRSITPGLALGGGMSFGGGRGTLFASNFGSSIHEIDLQSGDVINTINPTGTIYGLGYSEGAGLLFAQNISSGTTEAYNPDTGEVEFTLPTGFSPALASDEAGNKWLKIGEGSLVAAGESIEVVITFDAKGLNAGDYLSHILVQSNDPVTPLVTVPASLHVIGAPNISLSPGDLGFGNVIIGTHASLPIEIGNNGTDVLTVTQFSLPIPVFSIEEGGDTPFSLAPGEKRTLTIRFTSTLVGVFTSNLSIDSNDPDQSTMAVPLSGTGIEPPIIQVSPLSITADLYTGEAEDHPITVLNSGGSNLQWQADIDFQEPDPFSQLGDSPAPLTRFTIDPTTQYMYGQRSGGNQFYRYDPNTNVWASLASSPITSNNHGGATYLGGKIYTVYSDTWQMGVYDIVSDTWTTAYGGPVATGNITSDGTYLYTAYGALLMRYDPSSDSWTILAWSPFNFEYSGALAYDNGKIYGHAGNGQVGFAEYSIASNTWVELPSLPDTAAIGATIDPIRKNYYAYGGAGGANLYVYNIPNQSWSIEQIPLFAVDGGGMAYVKKQGKRGVYFLQGGAGTGFAKFDFASAHWLTLESTSGDVGVGETFNVNARIDATGLVSGEYSATIHFNSNDPVTAQVSVPVTLTVTGAPDLSVSPSSVDFGQVFINGEKSYVLTLTNEGAEVLNIASISSDSPLFTVNQPAASLDPDELDYVVVTCRPTTAGSFAGGITIQTNDPVNPEIHVELSSMGIDGPVIQVTPTSIASDLGAGESEDHPITVHNSGGSNLLWQIDIDFQEPATSEFLRLADTPVPITSLTIDPTTQYMYGQRSVGSQFFRYDVDTDLWTPLASSPVSSIDVGGATYLDGKVYTKHFGDYRMGVYDIGSDSWTIVTTSINTSNITSDGTYLYIAAYNDFRRFDPSSGSWTELALPPFSFDPRGALAHDNGKIFGHEGGGRIGFAEYSIATNTWVKLPSVPNGAIFGAAIDPIKKTYFAYGSQTGTNLYAYNIPKKTWSVVKMPVDVNDGGMVFCNQAGKRGVYFLRSWLSTMFTRFDTGDAPWLTLESIIGDVGVGETLNLNARIDATNLIAGEYSATIHFNSNDPLTPQASVPVTLTVDGAPDLSVSPSSLDFGQPFIGSAQSNALTLMNEGTDVLTIASVSSDSPLFTVNQPVASLNPGEVETLTVTFRPTSAGSFTGRITIQTNDPVNPLVFVDLLGVGVPPPIITVTPAALSETLLTGNQVTRMLTVGNTGTTNLTFDKAIEFDLPTRVFMLINANTIHESDPISASTTLIATPEPASGHADGLAFDGRSLYFINGSGTQKIYQLERGTGKVIRERSFPSIQPIDALAHSGKLLYALSYNSGIIYEIDFATGSILRGITPGVSIRGGMSFGGRRGTLFVSSPPYILEIDIFNNQTINTINANGLINGLGYSNGTGLLYVQNATSNSLDAYNPDSGELIHTSSTVFSSALASDEAAFPSWLAIATGSLVAPGQSSQLAVDFDAEGLPPSEYTASIVFNSNDPVRPLVSVPVTLTVTLPTAIEPEQVVDLVLSPNPASQEVHVSFTTTTVDRIEYSLTDLTGKTLWTVSENRDAGRHTLTTSVASLPEGLYLFRFTSRDYVTTQRVVILRE